jgi:outer membrane receptor protein involved in Fe transport
MMKRALTIATLLLPALFARVSAQQSEGTIVVFVADRTPSLESSLLMRILEKSTLALVQEHTITANSPVTVRNVPFGTYRIELIADSVVVNERVVSVRTSVPLSVRFESLREYDLPEITISHPAANSTSTEAAFTASAIELLPAVSSSKKIEAMLLASPGVVPDEDGRMHIRGEHADLQYIVDGIPITADLSRIYSSLLNADIIKGVSIQRGALNPEYGIETAGIVAVTTKSGFDAPLTVHGAAQYGSFGTREASLEVGGNIANQTAFFGAARAGESNRYLDPISGFSPIHAYGSNRSVFGKFNAILGATLQLNALGQFNTTRYEIPNATPSSIQNQQQKMDDYLVGGRVTAQFNPSSTLSALLYTRRSTARLTSGGLERIATAADSVTAVQQNEKFFIGANRSLEHHGGQLEFSSRFNGMDALHELKVAVGGEVYPIHEFVTFAVTNPALSDSALPGGDYRYRAIDITQGGIPFMVDQAQRGTRFSAYAQDALHIDRWDVGFGVRFDVFHLFETESNLSPRLNIAYRFNDDLVLRASYNRIVMQAPLEYILTSSSDEARTLAGREQGSIPTRVMSERSHVVEIGAQYQVNRFVDVELNGYTKLIDDFLAKVELGNSEVIFPVNLKQGFVAGGELTARLRSWNRLTASLSVSVCASRAFIPEDGSTPVAAGLILGEEGKNYSSPYRGEDSFPTEHNQLITATLNVNYLYSDEWSATFAARFDSGLPFDLAGANGQGLDEAQSRVELRQRGYSDAVVDLLDLSAEMPGSPDKSVAPHVVLDAGIQFSPRALPVRIAGNILNVFDQKYLYKFESSFGGTHFGVPRTFVARVELYL